MRAFLSVRCEANPKPDPPKVGKESMAIPRITKVRDQYKQYNERRRNNFENFKSAFQTLVKNEWDARVNLFNEWKKIAEDDIKTVKDVCKEDNADNNDQSSGKNTLNKKNDPYIDP